MKYSTEPKCRFEDGVKGGGKMRWVAFGLGEYCGDVLREEGDSERGMECRDGSGKRMLPPKSGDEWFSF